MADFLLNLSERVQLRGQAASEFILPLRQQDISHKIGIAFETLSRIFQSFQKQDIIKINMRTVQIKDFNKLRDISGY